MLFILLIIHSIFLSSAIDDNFISQQSKYEKYNFQTRKTLHVLSNHTISHYRSLPQFHLFWTTSEHHFRNWRLIVILSIQRTYQHQDIRINIYSNTLDVKNIAVHPDFEKVNKSSLFFHRIDNQLFSGTPLEKWWLEHKEFHGVLPLTDFRYSHITDLARLVALWKYGGTYLDFDMVLLRPLTLFANSFAIQSDFKGGQSMRELYDALNFAIAIFERRHMFLVHLMQQLPAVYDPTQWPCVGPMLITVEAGKWLAKTNKVTIREELPTVHMLTDKVSINIFNHQWFYPVYWDQWKIIIQKTEQSNNEVKRIMNNAVTMHIWSHLSNFSNIETDSVLDQIMQIYVKNKPIPKLDNNQIKTINKKNMNPYNFSITPTNWVEELYQKQYKGHMKKIN